VAAIGAPGVMMPVTRAWRGTRVCVPWFQPTS
jgi:hypothetical protein